MGTHFITEDEETISQLREIDKNNLDADWIASLSDYGIIGWEGDKLFFKDSISRDNWISNGYEIL